VNSEQLQKDLELAHELADLADAITMDRFQAADLTVTTKPDMSPVSDADQAVERAIRAAVEKQNPQDAVIGEEYGTTGNSKRLWVIDPIDGTKNYVRGVPVWATLISLIEDGESVLGFVSAPALSRRWWATKNNGAWVQFEKQPAKQIKVSQVESLKDAFFGYSSKDEWIEIGKEKQFAQLVDSVWRTRAFGDFWTHLMVAEGVIDCSADPILNLWDLAALVVIVSEAGGIATTLDGSNPLQGSNMVATNGLLHKAVLNTLNS
jgi:histidinol-phosphatase